MISFEKFIRPIMEIKKGEWTKTILTFLYFYLTITAYYILKPARNSLYINYLGADNIPYAIMFIAIISYFVISVYTKYAEKVEHNRVVTLFLFASVACLFIFRWAFQFESNNIASITSFIFFIWVTLFSGITVMQFWVLANDVFDSQAAKRLYGFVGTGGILGGMTGGFIAMYAKKLETENLLLVASGYIILMIILYNFIWSREKHNLVKETIKNDEKITKKEAFHIIKNSKYLIYVLLIVGLMKFVTVQTEWQYNKFVEIQVSNKNDMTVFFGQIFASLSIIALMIQLLITSRVLKKFSFKGALMPLPLGLFLGSLTIIFFPFLWAASILKISDGSLRYSINQTATNYLYLPVSRQVRYKIKPFIDVFVYQFAKGFGGLLTKIYLVVIVFFQVNEGIKASAISYINICLLAVWILVIFLLKKEYPNEIRKFLKGNSSHKKKRKELRTSFIKDFFDKAPSEVIKEYEDLLSESHKRSVNVRLAVCVALYEGGEDKDRLRTFIEEIVKTEGIIDKPYFSNSQDEVNELLHALADRKDASSRYDAIKTLNKIRIKNGTLDFDTDIIHKEVLQEINDYYKSFMTYLLYESLLKRNKKDNNQKDFLNIALENILDENVERIFRLLGLLYNSVDVYTVYQGLLDDNVFVRANSLELLDGILKDKKLKKKIYPLLDGELSLFGPERAGYFTSKMKLNRVDAIKNALHSDDRWLCVCAMFMIMKFKFTELYEEVQKIAKSKDGLRNEAAQFIIKRISSPNGAVNNA